MTEKPKMNSESAKELDKAEKQFENFEKQVKDLTLDRMATAPKEEKEQQTKLSQNEIARSKDVYLKPVRSATSREKFNEAFRQEWNFKREYVQFIAEHKELIGQMLEFWTKPFPGVPGEYWEVPTNRPVWAPRYVAEQIKGCKYHRLSMEESAESGNYAEGYGFAQRYGKIVVDSVVQRLDAIPVTNKKSIFMGKESI